MSGHVGNLSAQQETTLQLFKFAVKDIPNKPDDSDYFYLRWLREGKFNLRKTEVMFRNYMEYRKKYGADTILEDYTPPEILEECLAGGYFGEDLGGHPVWYDNIGNLDPRGIYRSLWNMDEIQKYKCLQHVELDLKVKEASQQKGRHIERVSAVIDLKNVTWEKHVYPPVVEHFKQLLKTLQDNNPERIEHILFVHPPQAFISFFRVIRYVLDAKIRDAIVVCNQLHELKRYISPDQLPEIYGGNRSDTEFFEHVKPGRDVPPKYFLSSRTATRRGEMKKIIVGKNASFKVRHKVPEPGYTLHWEYFTTNRDISFRVTLNRKVAGRKDKKIIFRSVRPESHLFPQDGQHTCQVAGEYVFKFDNTNSWRHARELFYIIKVLSPDEEPARASSSISKQPSRARSITSSVDASEQTTPSLLGSLNQTEGVSDGDVLQESIHQWLNLGEKMVKRRYSIGSDKGDDLISDPVNDSAQLDGDENVHKALDRSHSAEVFKPISNRPRFNSCGECEEFENSSDFLEEKFEQWLHQGEKLIQTQRSIRKNSSRESMHRNDSDISQHAVLRELIAITVEWRHLASSLDIPLHDIKAIECDYQGNVRKCVEKMVEKWFQLQSSQLSWSKLCIALSDPLVARPDLAATIERKYTIALNQ